MHRFEGKVAVVTGGASGLGEAIASRLAREGAAVLLADRDAERGAGVARRLAGEGLAAAYLAVDVTRAAECGAAVRSAVERWGGLDLLVNSAGVGEGAAVEALDEATWDRVIDVNLKGTFLCSRAAFPALAERGGGCILNLASLAGLVTGPGMSAYSASKGGVIQLTRVLALEGAQRKIRANALCPIWTETPMLERFLNAGSNPQGLRRQMVSMVPMRRLGTAEDVAAAALFLMSDEAAFITGVALPIDGGALCQ